MARTYVITGSASGIGLATATMLHARGDVVIGVDRHDAEVVADLSTEQGRQDMVRAVTERTDGHIDAVVANAGLATPTAATVAVNYYGAVATLEGLRPLLLRWRGAVTFGFGLIQKVHQVIKRQRTGHFIGMEATLQIDLGSCAGRAPVMPGQASRGSRTWPRQGNILGLHLHLWSD